MIDVVPAASGTSKIVSAALAAQKTQVVATRPDSILLAAESARLTEAAGATEAATRERLLHAMASMARLATRPLTDADWHRLLDAAVLMTI